MRWIDDYVDVFCGLARLTCLSPAEDIKVTDEEVEKFDFYAQYAAAAYCNSEADVNSTITCGDNACPEVTSAGATVFATFRCVAVPQWTPGSLPVECTIVRPTNSYSSGKVTDIQGFVSTDDTNKLIVVSYRGSSSIRNWIAE